MTQRHVWIDYAKAIGIILVVYGHVARGVVNAGIELEHSWYLLIDSVIYSFHMPLFFFLAGVCFMDPIVRQGRKRFLLSKLDTVFYPYILWSLLQGGIEVGLSQYTNGQVSLIEVLSLWQPRSHFWFLYALLLMFAFASVLLYRSNQQHSLIIKATKPRSFGLYGYWLGLVSVFGLCFCYQNQLPNPLNLGFFYNNFVFFLLGVAFSQTQLVHLRLADDQLDDNKDKRSKAESDKRACWFTLGLAVALQWLFHGYVGRLYSDGGLLLFAVALSSVAAVVAGCQALANWEETNWQNGNWPSGNWPSSKVLFSLLMLKCLGAGSMSIYLAHVLTGSGMRIMLAKGLAIESAFLHLLAGTLAGILLPLLLLLATHNNRLVWLLRAPISQYLQPVLNKASRLKRQI